MSLRQGLRTVLPGCIEVGFPEGEGGVRGRGGYRKVPSPLLLAGPLLRSRPPKYSQGVWGGDPAEMEFCAF